MLQNKTEQTQWEAYPQPYRPDASKLVVRWILNGESGSVIGLPGVGRSTFLDILCNRPDALTHYLTNADINIVILPVDLNIVPDATLSTFYRVLLRAFYEGRNKFPTLLQKAISNTYQAHSGTTDAFLAQSALLQLLQFSEEEQVRVVSVLNHFGKFCDSFATVEMMRTLRSLRDKYKRTLIYIAGLEKEFDYFAEPSIIEPLRDLLDSNVHWLKPLNEDNAYHIIQYHLRAAATPVSKRDIAQIYRLTGGYPALIRVVCQWWCAALTKPEFLQLVDILLELPDVRHRLSKIWHSLTQAEQFALSKLKASDGWPLIPANSQYANEINDLQKKGLCEYGPDGEIVSGTLLSSFISRLESHGRGKIWFDEATGNFYQGSTMLNELTQQETELLRYFVENPFTWHSQDDIVEGAWSDVANKEGVTPQAVYQQIRGLRKRIEPVPSSPVYIVTKRGGYRFFPEGQPNG